MSPTDTGRRLSRATDGQPVAPVKLVHLGVGNFFRSHQAYYTEAANRAAGEGQRWGYAAFTGRSAAIADELAPQDGLYTLVVQGPSGHDYQVISSLSAVHPAGDLESWRRYFADPELAVVTSTVTEAGYCRAADGHLDLADPKVAADIAALTKDGTAAEVVTAPGKFVLGLLVRRAANAGPVTFCPCDNVPENGEMAERVIRDMAQVVDPALVDYIDAGIGFATTMVDRITPRATDADRAAVLRDTGVDDPAAVTAEPFSEWCLSGNFTNGCPAWDVAGAKFVADIVPEETRKLWLLNGSHSLMAYTGPLFGHETVFDAINDERIRGWVEEWWDVAQGHLPLPAAEVTAYRAALIERYQNPNIKHLLAQIAADGSQKIAIRHVPVILADRCAGSIPYGATRAVAAWVVHLRGLGAPITDARADEVKALVTGTLAESVDGVLQFLGIADDEVEGIVLNQARELEALAG